MNILDFKHLLEVIEETNSYVKAICPVCHEPNLKISKSSTARGAYKCYANYCQSKLIREKLNITGILGANYELSPYRREVVPSPFSDSSIVSRIASSCPVSTIEGSLMTCIPPGPLQRLQSLFDVDGETVSKVTTFYPYSETQRVCRVDTIPGKKVIYLQVKNKKGEWQLSKGRNLWPPYLRGIDLNQCEGNTLLMVEGEKTAEFAKTELSLACTTVATPFFQIEGLYRVLRFLFSKYKNVLQIMYVPDNDIPGISKAEHVQMVCNYLKKPCLIVPPQTFLGLSIIPPKGFDIADVGTLPEPIRTSISSYSR